MSEDAFDWDRIYAAFGDSVTMLSELAPARMECPRISPADADALRPWTECLDGDLP